VTGGFLSKAAARPQRALSPREEQVLAMVAGGLSEDAIAEILYLSPFTVKSHMKHVMMKLDARNRVHAVAIALRNGIID
jgi:DNA-binding CsgD family transcriptional regulator